MNSRKLFLARVIRFHSQIKVWWRGGDPLAENDGFFNLRFPCRLMSADEFASEAAEWRDHIVQSVYLNASQCGGKSRNIKIRDVRFINFGAKRTVFVGVQFIKCVFQDCRLLGVEFQNCEFHKCEFISTCTHKIRFSGTYVDPISFARCIPRRIKYANIGVHLFQQLCRNANGAYQIDHLEVSEYEFRKWLGREFLQQLLGNKITIWEFAPKWLSNAFREQMAGYGLRPVRTLSMTLFFLAVVSIFNGWLWEDFTMKGIEQFNQTEPWLLPIYFSIVTLSTVGYGDLTPTTSIGVVAASCEALLGLLWLSFCASVVIKKITR